jgi:hypothetical protein
MRAMNRLIRKKKKHESCNEIEKPKIQKHELVPTRKEHRQRKTRNEHLPVEIGVVPPANGP